MIYLTIKEIEQRNKASGGHWFSKGAKAFFQSRVVTDVLHGRFFISRETNPSGKTAYSVREAGERGNIETIGEFHSHKTVQAARRWLAGYLAAKSEVES